MRLRMEIYRESDDDFRLVCVCASLFLKKAVLYSFMKYIGKYISAERLFTREGKQYVETNC